MIMTENPKLVSGFSIFLYTIIALYCFIELAVSIINYKTPSLLII